MDPPRHPRVPPRDLGAVGTYLTGVLLGVTVLVTL